MSPEDGAPGVIFTRFFLPVSSQHNPYLDTGIDMKSRIDKMDREESHRFMLDGFLTSGERALNEGEPRVNRNSSLGMPGGEPSHRGYYKGSWSPYGVGANARCLLTLVTYDHRVMILGREGHKWTTLVDISQMWYEKISADSWKLVRVPKNVQLHEVHIARMSMLCVSEILWTPVFYDCDECFCILIVLTLSGHAAFWKIPVEFASSKEIQLITVVETNMKMISAVDWFPIDESSGYLTIGSSNGQVKIFYCKCTEDFTMRDLGYAYSSADKLRVTQLKLLPLQDKLHVLIAGKHRFAVAVVLSLDDIQLEFHCMSHRELGKLAISGLVCLENNNLYFSMKDGCVRHARLQFSDDSVVIEEAGVPFQTDGVSYISLVTSPHGTLWGILESVSVAYDHLIVREPSQLVIYQVGRDSKIFEYLNESPVSLHLNADLLEGLRIYICKSGKLSIKIATQDEAKDLNELQCKLHFWLAKMCRSIEVGNQDDKNSLKEIETSLGGKILQLWIMSTIQRFSKGKLNVVPMLMLSLSLMCQWAIDHLEEGEKNTAKSLSKKLNYMDKERCPLCLEDVPLDMLTSGTCPKGHTLPRCCRTLLLTRPVIMCSHCKVFAHKIAAVLQEEKIITCVFCDGRMIDLTSRA